ncbi:hypothetical protein NQZ68_019307 [Dissostichus eleginoides]|nr:hypothetical protein NQZ68_019307 [Dissostichus eleginoides]
MQADTVLHLYHFSAASSSPVAMRQLQSLIGKRPPFFFVTTCPDADNISFSAFLRTQLAFSGAAHSDFEHYYLCASCQPQARRTPEQVPRY